MDIKPFKGYRYDSSVVEDASIFLASRNDAEDATINPSARKDKKTK